MAQAPRPVPSFRYEEAIWSSDSLHVAGVDEVGRGPVAGPVFAAAVILDPAKKRTRWMRDLRDSKMLEAAERERLAAAVRKEALAWSVSWSTVREINAWGISKANYTAMVRAISSLDVAPEHLLIDGPITVDHPLPQTAIIDGDAYCTSIAAASVIAKVARDALMCDLGYFYPKYGFELHKGYATKEHLERIERYGVCSQHRYSWLAVQRRHAVFTGSEQDDDTDLEIPDFLTAASMAQMSNVEAHNGVMDSMGTAHLV